LAADKKIDVGEGGPRRAKAVFGTFKRAEGGRIPRIARFGPVEPASPPASAPQYSNTPILLHSISDTSPTPCVPVPDDHNAGKKYFFLK